MNEENNLKMVFNTDKGEFYILEGLNKIRLVNIQDYHRNFRDKKYADLYDKVKEISDSELEKYNEINVSTRDRAATVSLYSDLRSGHFMHSTNVGVFPDGQVSGQTRTWSTDWLSGFHGAVFVQLADQEGRLVSHLIKRRYGVDACWAGSCDRTESWSENVGPQAASLARQILISHAWDPNNLEQRLNALASTARTVTGWLDANRDLADAATRFIGMGASAAGF